jgi:hypothetical protein
MKTEPLFGDKPKKEIKKRRYVTTLPLEQLKENTYKATDDDLPAVFWPEPDLDEEVEK